MFIMQWRKKITVEDNRKRMNVANFINIYTNIRNSRPDVFCKKKCSACNLIKKETLAQVFSCEFCEIFKYTSFYRTPLVAALEIFTPILYLTIITQNKNDSVNSILQHGHVVDKNCCVVFPVSRFPYLTLCSSQCKCHVEATSTLQSMRNKKNKSFIIFVRSIFR